MSRRQKKTRSGKTKAASPQEAVEPFVAPVVAPNWQHYTIDAALVVLVLIVFGQTIGFEFVRFDDNAYLFENPRVQVPLNFESLRWAFTSKYFNNWHPLTWISYLVDYQLFGLKAGGYHAVNVLFHALNAVLLFEVLRRMTGAQWRPTLVAALFAVHPVHVESVAWVSERKDVLSTFFCLLTIGAYWRYASRLSLQRYVPVVVFFVLGLMAKPMLVTLPCVLLLLDFWPLGRIGGMGYGVWGLGNPRVQASSPTPIVRLIVEKAPLFLLAAVASGLTVWAQGAGNSSIATVSSFPVGLRFAYALSAYGGYLYELFWPAGLAAFYPHKQPLPWWEPAGAAVLILGVSVASAIVRKRAPYLASGWFWFLGTLVPVIGLVQVGTQAMADRYAYLPSIGLSIAVVWGAAALFERTRTPRPAVAVASIAVVFVLTAVAFVQTGYWRNTEALFRHAAEVTDFNGMAHNNLGMEYQFQKRLDDAAREYKEAIRLDPMLPLGYGNLGAVLFSQGKYEEAAEVCRQGLNLDPNFVDTRNNLAAALAQLARYDEAITEFQLVLGQDPNHVNANINLARLMAIKGRMGEAVAFYGKVLDIDPGNVDARKELDGLKRQ